MKKLFILTAAVALMAMTACNEKAAKDGGDNQQPAATEQVKAAGDTTAPKVAPLEKPQPTQDGKDHAVAQFNTNEYQVTVENLADGTYRVKLAKDGKDEQVYETKNCRIQGNAYVMQTADGKNILINADKGQIVIMNKKEILYKGQSKQ
jgi:hypothetical protein